jgi:hypothetical protein
MFGFLNTNTIYYYNLLGMFVIDVGCWQSKVKKFCSLSDKKTNSHKQVLMYWKQNVFLFSNQHEDNI